MRILVTYTVTCAPPELLLRFTCAFLFFGLRVCSGTSTSGGGVGCGGVEWTIYIAGTLCPHNNQPSSSSPSWIQHASFAPPILALCCRPPQPEPFTVSSVAGRGLIARG